MFYSFNKPQQKYYIWYKDSITGNWTKTTNKEWNKDKQLTIQKRDEMWTEYQRQKKTIEVEKYKPVPKCLSEFKEVVLEYVNKNRDKGTYKIYERSLRFLIKYLGDKETNNVTADDAELYKELRQEDKVNKDPKNPIFVAPTTVNIELRALKSAFNLALEKPSLKKLNLKFNPFKGIEMLQTVENEKLCYEPEELTKLLKLMDPTFQDFTKFALYTGLRLAEITNLQFSDILIDKKVIQIRNKANFKTKTRKIRNIPMELPELLALVEKRYANRKGNVEEYLFENPQRGGKYSSGYVSRRFKHYLKLAKLNSECCFHMLRHTFITTCLRNNMSISKVQKLAGHSSIKTTQGYSHLNVNDMRDDMRNMSFGL